MDPIEIFNEEGVDKVIREGWVHWRAISDVELSQAYYQVVQAFDTYERELRIFEEKLSEKLGDQ